MCRHCSQSDAIIRPDIWLPGAPPMYTVPCAAVASLGLTNFRGFGRFRSGWTRIYPVWTRLLLFTRQSSRIHAASSCVADTNIIIIIIIINIMLALPAVVERAKIPAAIPFDPVDYAQRRVHEYSLKVDMFLPGKLYFYCTDVFVKGQMVTGEITCS
ncbi:hypothetical protein An06g01410 [Aspergillus niger]|uniref:Uncharacterized protein n=2 Tax=Aspergillus niger TaxID=5061 RepID=A2QLJ0_ASPNC|nr:hypothetical protein An06g01410 [Aspergillus niger]CAK47985.1 hypothetical protein An06g01410 [Aspergillus niger]